MDDVVRGPLALARAHQCGRAPHDRVTLIATTVVISGLILSYVPQHYRIIANRTSEGISPWFLLLGATSSASSLLNVLVLQWHVIRCCREWGTGGCAENLLGVLQIGFQWLCFNIVLFLFLVYYPRNKKYVHLVPLHSNDSAVLDHRAGMPHQSTWTRIRNLIWPSMGDYSISERSSPASSRSSSVSVDETHAHSSRLATLLLSRSSLSLSPEYRAALFVVATTALHFVICTAITFILLLTLPRFSDNPAEDDPEPLPGQDERPSVRAVRTWATVLGVVSTLLAMMQYLPQIVLTARTKLVGSLSIPMMCIQSPGSFVFVATLAARPGTDWTTWGVFLVTGVLQFALLLMCIGWKARQKRLGIDDFGQRLEAEPSRQAAAERDPLLRRSSAAVRPTAP